MIIKSTAPARISLFGGGTDIPSYSEKYGGSVISMAINLRQHITLFTEKDIWSIDQEIPEDASPDLLYKISEYFGMNSMHHRKIISSFDGEIGAGLGSSAAFSVAMIAAFCRLQDKHTDIPLMAWQAEQDLGWYGGKQDQYASAHGGLNFITFDENTHIHPYARDDANLLASYTTLFYIGGHRASSDIQRALEEPTKSQLVSLHKLKSLTFEAKELLKVGNMERLGLLLNQAWEIKKKTNTVSNKRVDEIYAKAMEYGALGGKLLGAGQSGYMMFMVKPQYRKEFIKNVENLGIKWVDFSPDYQGVEARIL